MTAGELFANPEVRSATNRIAHALYQFDQRVEASTSIDFFSEKATPSQRRALAMAKVAYVWGIETWGKPHVEVKV